MRGYDVIRELYQGNLHPCDRGFRSDTEFAITMEAFTTHEKWLRENLNEEARKRFDELISCISAGNLYLVLFFIFMIPMYQKTASKSNDFSTNRPIIAGKEAE